MRINSLPAIFILIGSERMVPDGKIVGYKLQVAQVFGLHPVPFFIGTEGILPDVLNAN